MVADALAPDGRVVMVDDGVRDAEGVARFASDPSGTGPSRRLPDGREFTIVKVAYAPDELEALLADLGWAAEVTLLSLESYVLVAHPSRRYETSSVEVARAPRPDRRGRHASRHSDRDVPPAPSRR